MNDSVHEYKGHMLRFMNKKYLDMFTMTCSAASDSIDEICNDSCTVLRLKSHFNNSLSVIYSPNATILLVYEAAKMEMSLVTKDKFVCKVVIRLSPLKYPLYELSS